MAEEKKKKNLTLTTGRGTFVFPKLDEPDTKFDAAGKYGLKFVQSEDDAAALIARIQTVYDEAIEAAEAEYKKLPVATRKKNPFKTVPFHNPVYDKDTEEETGEVVFNFTKTASGVSKKTGKAWTSKPAVFDAKGKPMKKLPQIWGGTIGKVSFEVVPFFVVAVGAGVSLRLQAVQVIDLVSGGNRSATDYGFGEEEDGYDYDPDEFAATGEDASGEGDEDKTPDADEF